MWANDRLLLLTLFSLILLSQIRFVVSVFDKSFSLLISGHLVEEHHLWHLLRSYDYFNLLAFVFMVVTIFHIKTASGMGMETELNRVVSVSQGSATRRSTCVLV